jgi:hypothetical protein
MKFKSLFNMSADVTDLLSFFEDVESPEQLISRLERLKRGSAEEMMTCIEGLRHSLTAAMDDTLEMSASLDDDDDDLDDDLPELDGPGDLTPNSESSETEISSDGKTEEK